MEENYEIENIYTDDSFELFRKLQKRTNIILVLYLVMFISSMFRRYQDFDVIFSSNFFRILLMVSVLMTLLNLSFYFRKDKFHEEATYNLLKKEKEAYELVSIIPMFVTIIVLFNSFLVSPAAVEGPSMEPSYYDGDTIAISHFNNYERYDVVIIKVEETTGYSYYIKRIIGLPGETIVIENNNIYIKDGSNLTLLEDTTELPNNALTACNYGSNPDITLTCEFTMSSDEYFVLGDNRMQSNDSRGSLGPVKKMDLFGEVIFKLNILD